MYVKIRINVNEIDGEDVQADVCLLVLLRAMSLSIVVSLPASHTNTQHRRGVVPSALQMYSDNY
jgi:hypothetical protein